MRIPKLDEDTTMKAALHYLERYAASTKGLQTVLQRRIQRARQRGAEVNQSEALENIEKALVRLKAMGYLNDKLFAEGQVASLRRRGRSGVQVRQKLQLKGVDAETTEAVLDTAPEIEKRAALQLAKRRRVGPFATPEARAENGQKHFAALARAGFSSNIIKWVLAGETPAALEAELDEEA